MESRINENPNIHSKFILHLRKCTDFNSKYLRQLSTDICLKSKFQKHRHLLIPGLIQTLHITFFKDAISFISPTT